MEKLEYDEGIYRVNYDDLRLKIDCFIIFWLQNVITTIGSIDLLNIKVIGVYVTNIHYI